MLVQWPKIDRKRRDKILQQFLRACPPVLLCAIAFLQIVLAQTHALSPWKGGGFGMFSSVDSPSARFIRAYLIDGEQEYAVLLPRHLGSVAQQARTMPNPVTLNLIARETARARWIMADLQPKNLYRDDTFVPVVRMVERDMPPATLATEIAFDHVRIELWRYTFNAADHRVYASKWLETIGKRSVQ
jgi:hypothetical protein